MKLKNTVLSTIIASTLSLTTMAAFAATSTTESYDISVTASIPSASFYVRPVDTGWINQVQEMEWNGARYLTN